MNKKYNETMIIRDGKLIYAIQLKDKEKDKDNRSFIYIDRGEIYFSSSWFTTNEFDFNNETHRIAKEIFINQLQTSIKTRVAELKQLESIFKELNLSECIGTIIPDSSKILIEAKKDIQEEVTKQIEEKIKPIARKKKKKIEENTKQEN
jgi:hypothetical protein